MTDDPTPPPGDRRPTLADGGRRPSVSIRDAMRLGDAPPDPPKPGHVESLLAAASRDSLPEAFTVVRAAVSATDTDTAAELRSRLGEFEGVLSTTAPANDSGTPALNVLLDASATPERVAAELTDLRTVDGVLAARFAVDRGTDHTADGWTPRRSTDGRAAPSDRGGAATPQPPAAGRTFDLHDGAAGGDRTTQAGGDTPDEGTGEGHPRSPREDPGSAPGAGDDGGDGGVGGDGDGRAGSAGNHRSGGAADIQSGATGSSRDVAGDRADALVSVLERALAASLSNEVDGDPTENPGALPLGAATADLARLFDQAEALAALVEADLPERLRSLEDAREGLESRVNRLGEAISERDERLARLERTLEERTERIARLEGALEERDDRLAVLERTITTATDRLDRLERTLEAARSDDGEPDLTGLEEQLSAVRESLESPPDAGRSVRLRERRTDRRGRSARSDAVSRTIEAVGSGADAGHDGTPGSQEGAAAGRSVLSDGRGRDADAVSAAASRTREHGDTGKRGGGSEEPTRSEEVRQTIEDIGDSAARSGLEQW